MDEHGKSISSDEIDLNSPGEISHILEKYRFTSEMYKIIMEMTANLYSARQFTEIGEIIFQGLQKTRYAEGSGCKLGVYFEEEDFFEIVFFVHREPPQSYFEIKSKIKDLKMFTKLTIESKKTILIPDSHSAYPISIDPNLKVLPRRTMIFIPLIYNEKLVGMFSYAIAGKDSISEELRYFLECVCKIVSIVIGGLLGDLKRQKLEEKIRKNNESDIKTLRKEIEKDDDRIDTIAESPVMKKIITEMRSIAKGKQTILIEGATGTGKEVIAKYIYKFSDRNDKPFVIINCSSLVSSIIESELFGYRKGAFTGAIQNRGGKLLPANGGTVLLDEIGDVPYEIQAKLLRFIENGEIQPIGESKIIKVDIRIIAATNRNLDKMVEQGKFREDLYYRLKGHHIQLPLLRERGDDIKILAEYFVKQFNSQNNRNIKGIEENALKLLTGYNYPGNVRELKNIITNACSKCRENIITINHLPNDLKTIKTIIQESFSEYKKMTVEEEKEIIIKTLLECKGNMKKTSDKLKIHRNTLWYKLKKYNISRKHDK